jgi:LysM repeat protein
VAEKATKAAPAIALAGALVASPQAQHAFAKPATVATAVATHGKPAAATLESVTAHGILAGATARVAASTHSTRLAAARTAAKNTYYKVQAGDTLSKIAEQYYHNANDWPWLYDQNGATVRDPNLIYTGETLLIPAHVPAGYVPRHAKPAAASASSETNGAAIVTTSTSAHSRSGSPAGSAGSGAHSGARHAHSHSGAHDRSGAHTGSGGSGSGVLGGTLGCSGLEQLWDAAGGNPADAFIAAEIAMAESGGNQYALSPTDDYGYWQINISNGSLATFDAYGNARAAIIISQDGTDWGPWTTYTSGAYIGRC